MKTSLLAIVAGLVGLAAIGDALLEPAVELGSTAVLGTALLLIIGRTLPKIVRTQRASLDDLSKRHDGWEHQRHEDSTELNATLKEMVAHCAGVQAGRKEE